MAADAFERSQPCSLDGLKLSQPQPQKHSEHQDIIMAKIDNNDDSVVVIIGSGAGGGTLAHELCTKGVKVVVLEAGAVIFSYRCTASQGFDAFRKSSA